MSILTDEESLKASEDEIFSIPSAFPGADGSAVPQYVGRGVRCSSLVTDANIDTLASAYGNLWKAGISNAFRNGGRCAIADLVDEFRDRIGKELLAELQLGLKNVGICSFLSNVAYDDNFQTKMLRHASATLRQYGQFVGNADVGKEDPFAWAKDPDSACFVPWAVSYYSNTARLLPRMPGVDIRTVNLFSALLARTEDGVGFDDLAPALSVAFAETLKRNDYRPPCNYDKASPRSLTSTVPFPQGRGCPKFDFPKDRVQIRALIYRLCNLPSRSGPVPVLHAVDLVAEILAMWGPKDAADTTAKPSTGLALCSMPGMEHLCRQQSRFHAMPEYCGIVPLGKSGRWALPYLAARSMYGTPSVLFPADEKSLGFLAKVYSVSLPDALTVMERRSDLVWAFRYEPVSLRRAIIDSGSVPRFYKAMEWRTGLQFSDLTDVFGSFVHFGERDLAEYMEMDTPTGLRFHEFLTGRC